MWNYLKIYLSIIVKKLEDLFRAYKDNIAMAFKDECNRLRPVTNNWNRDIIHDIANEAAKNFLNLFINK